MWADSKNKSLFLILTVMALLSAAFLTTDEPIQASKGQPAASSKQLATEPQRETNGFSAGVVVATNEPEEEPDSFETSEQILAAPWAPEVKFTITNDGFRFQSNGLPNHEFPDSYLRPQDNAFGEPRNGQSLTEENVIASVIATEVDQTITLNPILAANPTEAPDGVIGVLISGAQLSHDSNEIRVDLDTLETGFVDACNGHATTIPGRPNVVGDYHYHAVPRCTTDAVDIEGHHSSLVGVMIDGLPIYGSNDEGGAPILQSNLDACSGHFGPTPEFPDGIYHYHFVDEISKTPFPCLSGVLDTGDQQLQETPGGPQLALSNR